MTANRREHAVGVVPTGLISSADADAQADGLRMLLSMAVGESRPPWDEIPVRDERLLTVGQTPAPEPNGAVFTSAEPSSEAQASGELGQRQAEGGRHAAIAPPYLERRGARFVLFSAIGGFVFLLGLGLQAVLTGKWQVLPVVSYLIQAVASVETSFLLNRWLTWRDRDTPFWRAFARFNAQKAVTIALNLALYTALLRLGMNYLVANVALTAVFTVVNYVAGDRLVFIPGKTQPAEPLAPAAPILAREHPIPEVSVVIPCRGNEDTIRAAVQSVLDQDYPRIREIKLIGSPGDPTWSALVGIADPRLSIWELEAPPGVRDANFKRDAAVRMTSGEVIALLDSDIVLPRDWMSRAVAALEESGASCVSGGMKSFHDSFWGRYTDGTWIGAKTPRIAESYVVTSADFGTHGRKPPILANVLFTRELYDHCPIDALWSHGSYEDYEWFWRVAKAGYQIRVCRDLFGWHHHRRGWRALAREYRRSSRGCAHFIRAHMDSPLAKRRLLQAIVLPLVASVGAISAAAAAAHGYGTAVAGLVLGCAAVLAIHQVVRSRSLESLAYPIVGLALGLVFTTGLITYLLRPGKSTLEVTPVAQPLDSGPKQRLRLAQRRLLHPLTAILALQVGLSLTLVWSNTAFSDEANYLWLGHLEIQHWLHGTWWPSAYADAKLSGSPLIYPPIGAIADAIYGLAGARILSMLFMLGATALLYLVTLRLSNRTAAVLASAIWMVSVPDLKLSFATYDAFSVFLTTLSAWLIVRTAYTKYRGELVCAAAIVLALANATAFSGIVISPVVIGFAFLVWLSRIGVKQAWLCTAWLIATWAIILGILITISHTWAAITYTVFARHTLSFDRQNTLAILSNVWSWSGIAIALAVLGAFVAVATESRGRRLLFALCGAAVLVVPIAQIHDQTSVSLDKHLAYGVWFGAIAAGYGCSRMLSRFTSQRLVMALCGTILFIYPGVSGWVGAWQQFHGWPNARSFIAALSSPALKPQVDGGQGVISIAGGSYIAEYYIGQAQRWKQGINWTRWNERGLMLDPTATPQKSWDDFYSGMLNTSNYSLVVLFYVTNLSSPTLPGDVLLSPKRGNPSRQLLDLVVANTGHGEAGLAALTTALEDDREYQLAAFGPYDSMSNYGVYAIWQKKVQA